MSNSWTGITASIDTAEDKNGTFIVDRFEYHPSAADDDLVITNDDGDSIWIVRASAACANGEEYSKEILTFPYPRKFRGVYVATIDGGTLYIHKAEGSPT